MHTFTIVQIALFGAVAVSGQTRDICGDPVPTTEWYSNPLKVVEYLKQLESTERITNQMENHPFIEMIEKGQLTRDKMQDFIVQQVYGNEYDARTYGEGYNKFGFPYPKQDSREYFAHGLNATLHELDTLRTIGTKFGLDDMDTLMKHEPNPRSLMWSTVLAESVMHAQHHSEVVVAVVTLAPYYITCMQRIKKALETNAAYKSWNLDAKDLSFFDVESELFDKPEMNTIVAEIIRDAIDKRVTICEMRRRMNMFAIASLQFLDSMLSKEDWGPSKIGF